MKKISAYLFLFFLISTTWLLGAIPAAATHNGFIHAEGQCADSAGNKIGNCDEASLYVCKNNVDPSTSKAGFCKPINSSVGTVIPSNSTDSVFGKINPPSSVLSLGKGSAGLSNFLSRIITIIYAFAAIAVVFMVVYSALQMILSGGDKEKITQARNRLTYAIIGLVLLAFAFLIIRVLGNLTGFTLFSGGNTNFIAPTSVPTPSIPQGTRFAD